MKNKAKCFLGLVAIAAIIALIAACANPAGPSDHYDLMTTTLVTGVIVTGKSYVLVGTSKEFTAIVHGTGNPPQGVTWTLEGHSHEETTLSGIGVLFVHEDETAGTLTVRAASIHTPARYGTATVTVIDDPAQMPTVTGVTVNPSTATVNRGGSQTFTAQVDGANNPQQDVTWAVESGVAGTIINNASGLLTVAANETAVSLTVRATSMLDTTISGTAVVTVPQPTVTGVTINPSTAAVNRGGNQTFTATVAGDNNPPQDVTWTVTGAKAAGTSINNASGLLTVAANETAASLTVRAISTFNNAISATADVAVPLPIVMVRIPHGNVPFYISRHQITQHQWQDVMTGNSNNISATPSAHRAGGTRATYVAGLATANFPVEMVSWFDAIVFANRLSYQRGRTPVYSIVPIGGGAPTTNTNQWGLVPTARGEDFDRWRAVTIVPGNGYRLPTSAQWEFAGRAGATARFHNGINGFVIPTPPVGPPIGLTAGDLAAIAEIAWTLENSGGRTRQVGTRAPNAWGLYDIHGNVYEWHNDHDSFDNYRNRLSGGSWFRPATWANFEYRPTWYQYARLNHVGLRIMRLAN
ncbi:MAG: SUMF1/EgtB/PvdO family nonheme iron enzyme [Spirochaetes bacterium]|nr:SUMF1/EgtB/PvdO family nonheme iron enzyme [Spirochaetota bacterium]